MIPDTLQISYSRSLTSQPVPEGSELTLTCSAGIQSEQLTHLSIMFGKRGGGGSGGEVGTVTEIIAIDKLLGIVPGHSYKKRYDEGEITLQKRNGEAGMGVYVMKMGAVQPGDAGSYFCEASQWISDPDRSWQKIAQRTMDIGNLTIQQLGWCKENAVPCCLCCPNCDSMWQCLLHHLENEASRSADGLHLRQSKQNDSSFFTACQFKSAWTCSAVEYIGPFPALRPDACVPWHWMFSLLAA